MRTAGKAGKASKAGKAGKVGARQGQGGGKATNTGSLHRRFTAHLYGWPARPARSLRTAGKAGKASKAGKAGKAGKASRSKAGRTRSGHEAHAPSSYRGTFPMPPLPLSCFSPRYTRI